MVVTPAIHLDMVLVAVITLAILLRPACVNILLASLLRLVLPPFRHPAGLDRGVILARVALPRHPDKGGIHHLALAGKHPFGFEGRVKDGKQWLDEFIAGERFAEGPKGFFVRRLVRVGQSEKALEAQTVGDLKLELRVARAGIGSG